MNLFILIPLLIAPTSIITQTGGPTFVALTGVVNELLKPLDDLASQMVGLVSYDAVSTANQVAHDTTAIWGYLSYGSNLAPGLVSVSLLITLFLVVMLVKLIMSIVRYLKQLIAQWV